MSPALATDALTIGYGRRGRAVTVAADVSVALTSGTLTGLIGPNGSGKSTLLRTLTRLQPPLAGKIELLGRSLGRWSRRDLARHVATVLTDRVEVEHLRVREFVQLGRHPFLGPAGHLGPADHACVTAALESVSVASLSDRLLASLSDGQRQRVQIARALAQEPDVLILDEPTSFLDPTGRIVVLALLRRLAHERGFAVLVSTHEVELALRYCDSLWVVHDGALRSGDATTVARDGTIGAAFAVPGVRFCATRMAFDEIPGEQSS